MGNGVADCKALSTGAGWRLTSGPARRSPMPKPSLTLYLAAPRADFVPVSTALSRSWSLRWKNGVRRSLFGTRLCITGMS